MQEPLTLVLDITRKEHADNPHAFQEVEPQEYHVRDGNGQLSVARFPWDDTTVNDLEALHSTPPNLQARQRMGHRLATFLERTSWVQMESAIMAAAKKGQSVFLTIRSSAAEMYSLPFELIALLGSDQPLGRLPHLCIRYEWQATHTAPEEPNPRPAGGRILLAHSSAGGIAVPALDHQQAIAESMEKAGLPFDTNRDVLGGVTLSSLTKALTRTAHHEPVSILHLLVHGSEGGLAFSPDDASSSIGQVDGLTLANILQEHASSLRLVVLSACQSGDSQKPDSHIVGVAQALHRAGIETVVASRFPLTIQGSITFTKTFYKVLLEGPSSVESALVAAREALENNATKTIDWASVQLYRRAADGTDARPVVFRPYRGLLAFEEQHHKFFYGRDAERVTLRTRMEEAIVHRRPAFQMVIGAAGTGKSSLVMSGVSTELKKIGWNVVKLRPAERRGALPALFHALRKTRQALRAETANEDALPISSAEALSRESKRFSYDARGRRWLLIIDQFEEIFTLESSTEERRLFVETLLELSRTPELSVVVLCIMRVDYMARIGEIVVRDGPTKYSLDRIAYDANHTFSLTQMPQERLTDVMVKPAARVGIQFEHGLPERIMSDAGEEAAALPLLAYVLDELWLHRNGQRFTVDAYQQLNGFRGALGRAADAVFHGLDAQQKRQAKRFLEAMVSPGDGNRADARARAWTDLLKPTDPQQAADFDAALMKFAQSRLIVFGDELPDDPGAGAWAELAHDSLLQQWQTLRQWIIDDRETLAEIATLRTKATAFIKDPSVPEYLLYGKQLAQAIDLRDEKHELLDHDCLALIKASEAAEARRKADLEAEAARIAAAKEAAEARDRQELRRHLALAIAVITVLSAITAVTVLYYRRSAEATKRLIEANATVTEQQKRAEQSSKRARMAALLAISERLVDTDPTRALVFLREIEDPAQVHGFEETALRALENPAAEVVFEGQHGSIRGLAFTRDGGHVVAAGSEGTVFMVPTAGGDEKILTQHENGARISALTITPDGKRVVTAADDKEVRIASLEGNTSVVTLAHTSPPRALAANPKDDTLATASDSAPRIFKSKSAAKLPKVLGTPGDSTRNVTALAYRSDGVELASGASDGKIGLHSLSGQNNARFIDIVSGHIISLEYAPSGAQLLVLSDADPMDRIDAGPVHLVRLDAQGKTEPLAGEVRAHWAAFSPSGKHIALRSVDGSLRIVLATGEGEPWVPWPDKPITRADWGSDGQTIIAVDQDDMLHLRRVGASSDLATIPASCSVSRVAMSGDGKRIVVGCRAGEIRIFRVEPQLPRKIHITDPPRANQIVSAAWNKAGDQFAALVQNDGRRVLRIRGPSLIAEFVDVLETADGRDVVLSPDGAYAAVLEGERGVLIVPLRAAMDSSRLRENAPKVSPLRITDEWIHKVAFNAAGTLLATASSQGAACIFSVDKPEPSRCFLHKGSVHAISWLPGQDRILTASSDGRATIYSINQDEPLAQFKHDEPVVSAIASVDGQRIVTLTERKAARVWDTRTGSFKTTHSTHDGKFVFAAVSAQKILLAYNTGASLFDWELDQEKSLLLEGGLLETAAFSPDGDFVATVARDGATRIFRTDLGTLVATLNENSTPIRWLTWSPEPQLSLLTASTNGIVHTRPLRIPDITSKLWAASAYCPSVSLRQRVLGDDTIEAQQGADTCMKRVAEHRRGRSL